MKSLCLPRAGGGVLFLLLWTVTGWGAPPVDTGEVIPLSEEFRDSLAQELVLPTLIRLAYERNPRIHAARTEWQAAIEKIPQSTSLPDPMVMAGYFLRSVETRVGPQRYRASISQTFPYPGTLDAMGEVLLKQVEIAQKQYEQTVRDVIVELKRSYHELAYLDRAIELSRQNQEILDHLVTLAASRYAQDAATYTDLLRAQSQRAQLDYDQVLLVELREVERTTIRSLLVLPPDTSLGSPQPIPYQPRELSLEALYRQALSQRQELQIAQLMAEKAAKATRLAHLRNKPMFKVDLMTVETGDALMLGVEDSGKNPWTIGVGLSIPLWSAKNDSRVREAQLNEQAAREKRASMEQQLQANLQRVLFRLQNARRLVELYENALIPQAEKAIEVSESWHAKENPQSLSGLLETQSVWLNFNLARARAIADYQQNLVRLEQLVGGSLDGER